MTIRVSIQWTETAQKHLLDLPKNIARGIVSKISEFESSDPRKAGKPLTGPLQNHRSITHGRYRAVFSCNEDKLANGDVLIHVKVTVVAVGIRRERDKRDIYQVAQKLMALGLIPSPRLDDQSQHKREV